MTSIENRKWHIGREIPIAVIILIVITVMSNVVLWIEFRSEVRSYMRSTDAKFLNLNKRMEAKKKDRIHKSTVLEMFKGRDIKIQAVVDDTQEIKTEVKDTNKMVQQILREMPRGQ